MEKNTLLSIFCFLFISIGFAQNKREIENIKNETNIGFLNYFASKKSFDFRENKALTDSLALVNNWPKTIFKDFQFSELICVDDKMQPIYYTTYNLGAGVTSRANKLYTGGGLGLNLHGEGMTSGIWDAGSAMPSHEIFGGRLTLMDNSPSTHFHAAHVAGTVI